VAEKQKAGSQIKKGAFSFLDKPDALQFFNEQPLYEDLCREVEYILRKRLKKDGISIAAIISRAKTYKSVCDKLARPDCQGTPERLRDRAGARLVYLYKSDFPKIEAAITDEFTVVDKKDIAAEQDPGQFGYTDVKFYVKLKKQTGPRYDDLKNLLCEIQVRTVMQDAWGIISRDLVYTKESQIPNEILKDLTSFVGIFRIADSTFNGIRAALDKKRAQIGAKADDDFLSQPINLDTLTAFVQKYLPTTVVIHLDDPATERAQLKESVTILQQLGYENLDSVRLLLKNNSVLIRRMEETHKRGTAHGVLNVILAFADQKFRIVYPRLYALVQRAMNSD